MSIFSQVSEIVWNTLDLCIKHRINFGEETVSDLILLEIEKNNPGTIFTLQTSKADEKNKGTDWEWWIGNVSQGWARYAVQAKKIDKKGRNYNALAHKVGKTKRFQHDILNAYCVANNAFGLYAFYNFKEVSPNVNHWHCSQPYDDKRLGVTVTPVNNVTAAINTRGTRNFNSLHAHKDTLPLHCLLECLSGTDESNRTKNKNPHKHFEAPLQFQGVDIPNKLKGIKENPNSYMELYSDEIGLPAKVLVVNTGKQ